MNYQEFREEVFQTLLEKLPENVKIRLCEVEKLNGCKRYGIVFEKDDIQAAPTIYLEPFYKSFIQGSMLETLAEEILECFEEEISQIEEITVCVDRIWDYEQAHWNIFCKLIHYEKNKALLQDVPHIRFLDLAVVAYFELEERMGQKGSILIRNVFLDAWHLDTEPFFENALERTRQGKKCCFIPLAQLVQQYGMPLHQLSYEEIPETLYILTEQEKQFGAIFAYDPKVLQHIYAQLQEDFYLLPSSIHEWIIVPISFGQDETLMRQTVQEINRTEVAEEEILSDQIYLYSHTKKQLCCVE